MGLLVSCSDRSRTEVREGHTGLGVWPKLHAVLDVFCANGATKEGEHQISSGVKGPRLHVPWVSKGDKECVDLEIQRADEPGAKREDLRLLACCQLNWVERNFTAPLLFLADKPHNPMINAGAIVTTSLLKPDLPMADRFDFVSDEVANTFLCSLSCCLELFTTTD